MIQDSGDMGGTISSTATNANGEQTTTTIPIKKAIIDQPTNTGYSYNINGDVVKDTSITSTVTDANGEQTTTTIPIKKAIIDQPKNGPTYDVYGNPDYNPYDSNSVAGAQMKKGEYALTGETKTIGNKVYAKDTAGRWVRSDRVNNNLIFTPVDIANISEDTSSNDSYIDLGAAGNNNGILIQNSKGLMEQGIDIGNGTYMAESDYNAALSLARAASTKGHMPVETIELPEMHVKTIKAMYSGNSGLNFELETAILEPDFLVTNRPASKNTIPVMSPTGLQLGNIVFDLNDNMFHTYMYDIEGGLGYAKDVVPDYNGVFNINKPSISGSGFTDITKQPTVHEYTLGASNNKLDLGSISGDNTLKAGVGGGLLGVFTDPNSLLYVDTSKFNAQGLKNSLTDEIKFGPTTTRVDDLSYSLFQAGGLVNKGAMGVSGFVENLLPSGPTRSVGGAILETGLSIPGSSLQLAAGSVMFYESSKQAPWAAGFALNDINEASKASTKEAMQQDELKTRLTFGLNLALMGGAIKGVGTNKVLGTSVQDPMLTGVTKRGVVDKVTFEAIARNEIMQTPKEYRAQTGAAIDIMRVSDELKLRTNAEPSLTGLANLKDEWTPAIKEVLGKDAAKETRVYGGAAEQSEILNLPESLKNNVNIIDRSHHDIDVLTVAGKSDDLAKMFADKLNAKFPDAKLTAEGGEVLTPEGKHILDIHDMFNPDEGVSNLLPAPKTEQLYIPGVKGYKGGFRSEGLTYLTMRKSNAFVTNVKDLMSPTQHRFETDLTDLLKDANILRASVKDKNPKLYNRLTNNIETLATKQYTYRTREGIVTSESGQAIFDRISKGTNTQQGSLRINVYRSPSSTFKALKSPHSTLSTSLGIGSLGLSSMAFTSRGSRSSSRSNSPNIKSPSLGIKSPSTSVKSSNIKSPSLGIKMPSMGIRIPSPGYKIPPPSRSIIPPPSKSVIPPPPPPSPTPRYGGLINGGNAGANNPFSFGSTSKRWKNFGIMSDYMETPKRSSKKRRHSR